MRREYRKRFPRHRLQRKSLVSDPAIHHGTCIMHVPWCMSGSLTRGCGENVPGACATRNFTYLERGPWPPGYMVPLSRFPALIAEIPASFERERGRGRHGSCYCRGTFRGIRITFAYNKPKSQIPQCICSISHNSPLKTGMCTFLFWMFFGG